ncbi:MAG: hypothetical protein AAF492_10945 [Verrucomicrobiota bacterium]
MKKARITVSLIVAFGLFGQIADAQSSNRDRKARRMLQVYDLESSMEKKMKGEDILLYPMYLAADRCGRSDR